MNKKVFCPYCNKETDCEQEGALKGNFISLGDICGSSFGAAFSSPLSRFIRKWYGGTTDSQISRDTETGKYKCCECGKVIEEITKEDEFLD